MTTQSTPTFYDILGVSRKATTREIKEAYRKLAREHHPDSYAEALKDAKATGNKRLIAILEEKIKDAQEELKRINEAYATLSDHAKRRRYDEELDKRAQQTPPPSSAYPPPKIRLSKTSIDFGQLTKGKDHSDSFTIYNDGGPVSEIAIGWVENPPWAEVRISEDPTNTFPIKVTVLVNATHASLGRNAAALGILINGIPWGLIPITVTVVAPAQQPHAKPTRTRKTTPPPTPTHATSKPARKASKSSSDGCELLIILVGILVVIVLIIVIFGSGGGTNNSGNAPQSNQQSENSEQTEVQRAISNPSGIITVTRIRSVDCHEASIQNIEPYYPCEYKWAEYKLTNNSPHLAVSVMGDPLLNSMGRSICSVMPYGNVLEYLENDPNLRGGESFTLFCEESHLGKPIADCGLVNAWRWDGNYWQKILPNDQRVCWNK